MFAVLFCSDCLRLFLSRVIVILYPVTPKKVSVAMHNSYLIVFLGYISIWLINMLIKQEGKCFIY